MTARIKLLTPWCGPPPRWQEQFRKRMAANRIVDWETVPLTLEQFNALATERLGVRCRKNTFYNANCDLRPMYGHLFADKYEGYEFWGWCDVDVVFGDLDRLLPPLLDAHDVVTTAGNYVHGPLTVFRTGWTKSLYLTDDQWKDVVADPDYWNFDETGFNDGPAKTNDNPNLTDLVKRSGLRVHWDDRAWTESQELLPDTKGVPSRSCKLLKDGRLTEVPTGRELLLYHFTLLPKRWPLPNPHGVWSVKQRRHFNGTLGKPPEPPPMPAVEGSILSAEYWDARVEAVTGAGLPLYRAVCDTTEDAWDRMGREANEHLRRHVPEMSRVLDVGCGVGALNHIDGFKWTGIDVSPRMISVMRERYGSEVTAYVQDARKISFADDEFDWCVCRGLEGSVRVREGNREWVKIRTEMLRVAPRVLLLDYSGGAKVLRREDYNYAT